MQIVGSDYIFKLKENGDSLFVCPWAVIAKYCEIDNVFEGQLVIPIEPAGDEEIKVLLPDPGPEADDESKSENTENKISFIGIPCNNYIDMVPCTRVVKKRKD
jgi:hypothetical protein